MTKRLTIALDAMGGDDAPDVVVKGANMARNRYPDVAFRFYGDEARIAPLLGRFAKLSAVSRIHHTSVTISGGDKPSQALRSGRESSMGLAISAVKDGSAEGVVSAGNTGALMAMAKLLLRTLPGIARPAIATVLPTVKSECVMLDLGANIQCDARNLVEFAIMGEVFARTVLGLPKPTIGLLNVGEEDMKGHEIIREAATTLRRLSLPIEFRGFVEGDAVWAGAVDVVVADGFTGNVALKTAEGISRMYTTFLRSAFQSSIVARIGYLLARRAIGKVRARVDPRRYNGAMLLGLNGIVIKSHGGTDVFGFANAIGVAVDMARGGFNDRITEEFERTGTIAAPVQQKAAVS
jgi:glycerol-3-phosphate acyltransferase PlsX